MGETRDYETIRKMKESAVEINSKSEGYVMKSEYGALLRLRAYNEMGKSVYMNINGTIVYSCDVTTLNSGCKVYKGRTWDESKKKMSKLNEAKEKAFIELGKEYIYSEKMEEWKEFVEVVARTKDISYVELALDIMEKLESGLGISKIKQLYGEINSTVRYMILRFSKEGPIFYRDTSKDPLKESEEEEVKYIQAKNERLLEQKLLGKTAVSNKTSVNVKDIAKASEAEEITSSQIEDAKGEVEGPVIVENRDISKGE